MGAASDSKFQSSPYVAGSSIVKKTIHFLFSSWIMFTMKNCSNYSTYSLQDSIEILTSLMQPKDAKLKCKQASYMASDHKIKPSTLSVANFTYLFKMLQKKRKKNVVSKKYINKISLLHHWNISNKLISKHLDAKGLFIFIVRCKMWLQYIMVGVRFAYHRKLVFADTNGTI